MSTNLYSTLAETPEIKLARAVTELQSQVGRVGQQGALSPLPGQGVGWGTLRPHAAPCWQVVHRTHCH